MAFPLKLIDFAKRPWMARLFLGPCLLCAIGSVDAAEVTLRDAVVPPALLATMECSRARAMLVQEFAGQMQLTRDATAGQYDAQQVRAIMGSVDGTIEPVCQMLATTMAGAQRADLKFLDNDASWQRMLADPDAVAWLRQNSQFLAEIEALYTLAQLGSRLAAAPPGAGHPALQGGSAKDMAEMAPYAFTREESAARSVLASAANRPRLAAILPARFDVAGLAEKEARTRATGAPLLRRYGVSLATADTKTVTALREPAPAEMKALMDALTAASVRLKVLAQQYQALDAQRGK